MNDNMLYLVSNLIGEVTLDEITSALTPAVNKLQWILQREGDAGGERLRPNYLAHLIAEQIKANRFKDIRKRRTAEANTSLSNPLSIISA